ncbi:MAG TPA: hypothetical protein VHY19_06885 [Steroidobacteraceae bacterium]|jgi:hypothetical protein|nr:hypothetical protein [Steroidobacteraceae bacterium]
MSNPAIWTAQASAADAEALDKLLGALPEDIAADVRALATPPGRKRSGMRWSAQLRRAYFLQHAPDGVLSCITFEGVPSPEKAAELWTAIHDGELDMDGVCRAYAAVMGIEVEAVVRH